jgi:hypothetical protein
MAPKRAPSLLLFVAFVAAVLMFGTGLALAGPCTGPGAPTTTQTKCLTAVQIPGNPLRSFDISFFNPDRNEYYLAERSNAAIAVIKTNDLDAPVRMLGGFVGIKNNPMTGAVNNNISGPDGVTAHGRWLYAGDGDSTLKVFDLTAPNASALKQTIATVPDAVKPEDRTRVDEMALNSDGTLLIAANNAEDPPFLTLFAANGDASTSHVAKLVRIEATHAIIPPTFGLSIEQAAWEPKTKRFYVSIPTIAENPAGCNHGQLPGPITCSGGLMVIDPQNLPAPTLIDGVPTSVIGTFDSAHNTGVLPLTNCGPNGATVGLHSDLMLGCTPQNEPSNTTTLVINAKTKNTATVNGITGSDEVWFNAGDKRFYLGASRACGKPAGCPAPAGTRSPGGAVLGVVGADSILIETIPQSQNSHSVAADSKRNLIFVPQVGPNTNPHVGIGGDTTDVGKGICGSDNGCVAVYIHDVEGDDDHDDRGGDRK